MAMTVHLFLKASGSEIKGDSTQHGDEDKALVGSIECLSYEQETVTAREGGSAAATGRRQYLPIVIRKRIDRASPLLAKALCENQEIDGEFRFFRPEPGGDGTTQHFYSVAIKKGRVATIKQVSPDCLQPALSAQSSTPPLEEVGFVFHTIKQTYLDGGIEHEDTWDKAR